MSDHHHHHHDHSGPIAIGDTAARVVVGLLVAIGVLVLAGAVWLWPSAQHVDIPLPMQNAGGGAVETEAGTVISQDFGACGSPSIGKVFPDDPQPPRNNSYSCDRSIVSIDSGPHQGNKTLLEIAKGPGQPELHQGDKIRIVRQADPNGTPMYSFEDFARGLPLTIIAIVFAVVIIVVARWRGLRALLGLVFAFGVLVVFLLPALLDGKPAIPVALVSGALILYAVLYLAHGVNLRTSSALLGTLTSMVLAAVLSWVVLEMTHLTGLSEEQNTNVATYLQHVSITGLLLAGFIIGSLGVLNDVTITQASAAFELAALDEKATRRSIFAAAMRVGRDHIASTVYTLVLAYAGGALPLLLLFSVAGRSIRDVLTGDAVGIEIARSAVGGIALAMSVPLTTLIAVMLARPFGAKPVPAPARKRPAAKAGARTGPRAAGNRTPAARRTRTEADLDADVSLGDPGTPESPTVPRTATVVPPAPRITLQPNGPRTGDWPAQPRTGEFPAYGGNTPQQPNSGNYPPRGDQAPQQPNAGNYPPRGDQTPQQPNSGNYPPHGDQTPQQPTTGSFPAFGNQAAGQPTTGSFPAFGDPAAGQPATGGYSPYRGRTPGRFDSGDYQAAPEPQQDWFGSEPEPEPEQAAWPEQSGWPETPPEPPRGGRHSRPE